MAIDDTSGRQGFEPKVRPGTTNPGESDSTSNAGVRDPWNGAYYPPETKDFSGAANQQPVADDSTSNDGSSHNDSGGQVASNETSGAGGSGTAASGDGGNEAASGDGGNEAASGDGGNEAASGDNGATASGGDSGPMGDGHAADDSTNAGDDTTTAGGGGTTTTAGGGGAGATDGGGGTDSTAGGGGETAGGGDSSGHGSGGVPVVDVLLGGLGNGLFQDTVADTGSLAGHALADLQSGGNYLVSDLINGTDQGLGNAADHLGLGNVIGDNFLADTVGNLATTVGNLTDVLPGGIGHGLIPDAVADTQSLATPVLGDVTGSSGNLVNDVVNGATHLVDNAVNNLGIGDHGGLLGGLTGDLGDNINVGNLLGDGPVATGSLLDGDGGIVHTMSELTGGLTDGLLGSSNGDGPLAAIGFVEDGSPLVGKVLDNAGDGLLSDLGIGQIAKLTAGHHDADNNPAISANVGNNPGDTGPLVNTQVFGDNSASPGNLLDLNTGPDGGSGSSSGIIANVLGGTTDGSNPLVDGNLIGTSGQTLANANVLTSPDQFHFPVLDGAGSDSLSGVLGTNLGETIAGLPPDATPVIDLGTNPILNLNLAGEPHAADTHDPAHTSLIGQLLGSA